MGDNTSNICNSTRVVQRATATLPASTATAYFTVVGRVLLTQIVGEVVVASAAGANNMKLIANPTVGADVDLCAVKDVNAAAAGTIYTITGDQSDALQQTTSGAVDVDSMQERGVIVTAGTIDLSTSATIAVTPGTTKWTAQYIPLDPGSYIAVA